MKIFRIDRAASSRIDLTAELQRPDPAVLPVRLIPDSALVPKGFPVFLPEYARGWHFTAVPVFRIGRLGKSIAERFAPRYIDGVCAAAMLMPPDNITSDLACGFDGALTLSPFTTPSDGPVTLCVGERAVTIPPDELQLYASIAFISHFCTLRTGDLIIPCLSSLAIPAEIGLDTSLCIDGNPGRRLRVK